MAHEARLALLVRPAVAGVTIREGQLIRLTASGLKDDLPTALLATSGIRLNVYVAMAAPDNFARPTPGAMYRAGRTGTFYENGNWQDFQETDTFYYQGLSTYAEPTLVSGYLVRACRDGIFTVPSGVTTDNASLRTVGNLVKVADDNTGRWDYTADESVAIAKVVDWEPSLGNYTFELLGR